MARPFFPMRPVANRAMGPPPATRPTATFPFATEWLFFRGFAKDMSQASAISLPFSRRSPSYQGDRRDGSSSQSHKDCPAHASKPVGP